MTTPDPTFQTLKPYLVSTTIHLNAIGVDCVVMASSETEACQMVESGDHKGMELVITETLRHSAGSLSYEMDDTEAYELPALPMPDHQALSANLHGDLTQQQWPPMLALKVQVSDHTYYVIQKSGIPHILAARHQEDDPRSLTHKLLEDLGYTCVPLGDMEAFAETLRAEHAGQHAAQLNPTEGESVLKVLTQHPEFLRETLEKMPSAAALRSAPMHTAHIPDGTPGWTFVDSKGEVYQTLEPSAEEVARTNCWTQDSKGTWHNPEGESAASAEEAAEQLGFIRAQENAFTAQGVFKMNVSGQHVRLFGEDPQVSFERLRQRIISDLKQPDCKSDFERNVTEASVSIQFLGAPTPQGES